MTSGLDLVLEHRVDFEKARDRLLELLKEKSFRKGKVVLRSGKESDFYIDCKQTSLSAEGHLLIAKLFHHVVRKNFKKVCAVGGPTLGADPLVSAVATWSALNNDPLDAFIIRKGAKGHGTGQAIEGLANVKKGCPVVVMEDVVTTGGSTLRSISRCREAGLNVEGVVALVDRCEGGRQSIEQEGIKLYSLYSREDFLG